MGEQPLTLTTGILPDAVIFAAFGTMIYLWLVAVAAPFVSGIRASTAAARGDGWAPGLAVVLGLIFSVTAIPLAALFLAATFVPDVALQVVTSTGTLLGALCGVTVFAARSALLGLPRLSPRVELALAASAVSWNPDEEIEPYERAYREHILSPAPTGRARQATTPRRGHRVEALRHHHALRASPDIRRR
jgi:hypothetical protein